MTKAKKGLIITLFAAMMVFAFGVTSVFAASDPVYTWSDNYHKVTVTNVTEHNNTTYNAVVSFNPVNGMITATTQGATQDVSWTAPEVSYNFYDLTGAVFCDAYLDGEVVKYQAIVGTYNNGAATTGTYPGADTLKLVEPSYTTNYDAAKPKSAYVAASNGLVNYRGTIKETPEYKAAEVEQQQFDLTFSGTYTKAYDGTATYPEVLNTVAAKTVTVLAKTPEIKDATFYKDSADKSTNKIGAMSDGVYNVGFNYDGSKHSIVMAPLKGFSVAYSVLNATTGKWDTVDAIELTDVLESHYIQAKAVVTSDSDANVTATQFFNVGVWPAYGATFTWDPDDDVQKESYGYNVDEGTTYNPADYVIPNANDQLTGHEVSSSSSAKYEADKAAVKANKEELMAFFAEKYEFEKTTKKAYPDREYQAIKAKELTEVEEKALKEKYATLIANFGCYNSLIADTSKTATFYFVTATPKDDEINFTQAPNVTYKYKAIKKKAKSFTVEAVAQSGNTVTYTIDSPNKKITIDSATGIVKVAKKLKRGTYKVVVKAHTEAGNGYKAGYAERTLKIKVKK